MDSVVLRNTVKSRRFSGSWNTLSTYIKKGVWQVVTQMSEGRRSQVVLLDERRLDIIIQSKLYAGELLDIVASHFNIKEKEYFGIAFIDDSGLLSWLNLTKRVLEHDFPKKFSSQGAVLTFYFRVKYFVESITQLHDSATIEAYYLQAKSIVSKGEVHIDSEIVFQLAALVIQATCGDFIDENTFKVNLKRLPVLPTYTLKEFPSISICESKVLEHYQSLAGQTRGEAIVNYLSILESLPAYGQHYYEVKDKSGNPCWLTLSYRGISQYDKNDRTVPRRVFLWKQLENLYYRDRKFTVEVHEARRVVHTLSSFNLYEDAIEEPVEEFDDLSSAICDPTTQVSVSRRALAPSSVIVYVWYAASPIIAKCIWSMAIAQHGFFIDRSNRKSRSSVVRSLSQIATELCRSVQSLSSASSVSNISRSNSSASIPTIVIEGEISEESKAATIEMLTALQSRKDALEDTLKKKTDELKALCLKEGEITGELPPETPFQPGEPQPQVRRRVGTSFTLSDKIICRAKSKDRETLNDLELDYEIQSKIASAAYRLATEATARKSVRKFRKISYQQATNKLKDIEQKLSTLKREKESKKKSPDGSCEGSSGEKRSNNHLGLPASSSENSLADRNGSPSLNSGSVPPSASLPQLSDTACSSAPPSPAKCRQRHQSLQHVPVITTEVYEDVLPYNVNTRRNSSSYSATSEYDAVSYSGSGIASLSGLYRNRFEANLDLENTNHYSVPNRRASQAFNDPDELLLDGNSNALGHCSQYCVEDVPSSLYANNASLSSSYNERHFHEGDEFGIINDNRSNADSFEKCSIGSNSVLSYGDSNYVRNCDLIKQEKYLHSHSENSLHRQRANSFPHKFEHLHISEPELNLNANKCDSNLPHGYNPSLFRNTLRPTSSVLLGNISDYNCTIGNQTINQMPEIVSTPNISLDDKQVVSNLGCLEYNTSKSKTKEWIETSLDSPVMIRKKKSRQLDCPHPIDPCQQIHWADNGLPTTSENTYSSDSYYVYQNQSKNIDDNSASCNIQHQKPASPVQEQFIPNESSPNYGNAKEIYSSSLPSERIYVNSNRLVCNENAFRHYENVAEMPTNISNLSPIPPSTNYETTQRSYNSNFKPTCLYDDHGKKQNFTVFKETQALRLGVAEPQQPSKHQNKRINMGDVFASENLSCISQDPDYQNIPVDNQFQPVTYKESSNQSYNQVACDIPDSSNLNHHPNHSYLFEPQAVYKDAYNKSDAVDSPQMQTWRQSVTPVPLKDAFNNSDAVDGPQIQPWRQSVTPVPLKDAFNNSDAVDSPQMQTWRQSVTPVPLENPPLSPVSPSMNFSPSVEVNVVSVGHYQPYWEETKPYEISDFYKYSTKHRKQQKNSNVCDLVDPQTLVEKEASEVSQQYYEPILRDSTNVMYREFNCSNDVVPPSVAPKQHQELVTSHVPVFDSSNQIQSPAQYYAESSISSPGQQSDPDKSLSLGEVGLRISLADTFHDEMVAWYQNQDTVKKATLV